MANVNKSIQFTREDWIGIKDIKTKNPLCENHSDVLYYGFHDAAQNGIDFKQVPKFRFNDKDIDIDPGEYASAKSFSVEEDDWKSVVEEFKKQLAVEKVRISYLARLVISNYRMKLTKDTAPEKEVKVKSKTLDGVVLLQKANNRAAELIRSGNIEEVVAFIGEEV